jgi:hypothetical protein
MKTAILAGLILLTTTTLQAEEKKKLYSITINVEAKKANGKSWDVFGGSPDIKLVIDGQPLYSMARCRDRYRCTIEFASIKDKWYIEVYDKDLQNDDLIGKGECEEGESCDFGLAKVEISE